MCCSICRQDELDIDELVASQVHLALLFGILIRLDIGQLSSFYLFYHPKR